MAVSTAGIDLLKSALTKFNSQKGKKIANIAGKKGIGFEGLWNKLEARGENLTDNVLNATINDASKFLDDALERYYNRGYTDLVKEAENKYGQALSSGQLDILEKAYKKPLKDTDLSEYLKKRNRNIDDELNGILASDSFKNAATVGAPIQNGTASATTGIVKPINPKANSASIVAGDTEYNQYRLNAIQNYNYEMQATNEALAAQGLISEEAAKTEGFISHESQLPSSENGWKIDKSGRKTTTPGVKQKYMEALQRNRNQYNYDNPEFKVLDSNKNDSLIDNQSFERGAKIALGTAVTGAALCAALSSSRGQQNNAQLYGQQPLY